VSLAGHTEGGLREPPERVAGEADGERADDPGAVRLGEHLCERTLLVDLRAGSAGDEQGEDPYEEVDHSSGREAGARDPVHRAAAGRSPCGAGSPSRRPAGSSEEGHRILQSHHAVLVRNQRRPIVGRRARSVFVCQHADGQMVPDHARFMCGGVDVTLPADGPVGWARDAPVRGPGTWFLTAEERGNEHTLLDRRHPLGSAWSSGNRVRALVHGAAYFRELFDAVESMGSGDLLLFTDWRGDADERLRGSGTDVGTVFAAAARRGVDVRGLLWRSHLDRFQFSASENRHLGDEIKAAGGQCLLDMRVRPLGSHHQKLVVLRHARYPERDIAFIGGIDLCHGRCDDGDHRGDPQSQKMAAAYGPRPPWHDVQLAVQGPAVGDAETVFRERWDDPAPLSRNPVHLIGERVHRQDRTARPLPVQAPDPAPRGSDSAQLLRTSPARRPGYPFAPDGELSIARGYHKALAQARSLVYVEDQYLWSSDIARVFADALVREPELRLIVVIPLVPDQDGHASMPPNLAGREPALRLLRAAGGPRVAVYGLENATGTPIYVHAKVCVIDDTWVCVGSDNANRRSWTHDSELSCAVLHDGPDATESLARTLRLELAREHLGGSPADQDLIDPVRVFEAFRSRAAGLEAWHAAGRADPRPPGQLRAYVLRPLSWWTRRWASPMYRLLYDPDGRTARMRRERRF
jgi:phosphatidylserine/phosphatidylglycerophosphate/cardiolipin synthase-like enzyme